MKAIVSISIFAAASTLMMAEAHAQGRKPVPKNATSVVVTNMRQAVLNELDIATTTEPAVIAVKLAKPLAPGKSVTLQIKGKRGCSFDVRAAFSDDTPVESDGVDLCLDNKLRLTD